MAFILISAIFTYFKPIDIESIGYQFYNDKTYRVEKTNQITDLLHGERLIRRKVNEIKSQSNDPHRQIDLALSWVTQSVRPQDASPSPVISDDYYNILKRGSGYCDQAAYVFSVLSTRLGIPARMIMLRDRLGSSHHTASEVYLDGKWQFIDPWLGVWPHKSDGSSLSRFELAHDYPSLERLGYTKALTGYDFSHAVIFETFPFMSARNLLAKVWRRLGNLHESSSANPGGLSNLTQVIEAHKIGILSKAQIQYLVLFDKARYLHLFGNFDGAREIYSQILTISDFPILKDAAIFFYGVTYFDEKKYDMTENYFKDAIDFGRESNWLYSEYRFLAESLILQGKVEEAKIFLSKSKSQGALARLNFLEHKPNQNELLPFISY